jgi:hypothetical protein
MTRWDRTTATGTRFQRDRSHLADPETGITNARACGPNRRRDFSRYALAGLLPLGAVTSLVPQLYPGTRFGLAPSLFPPVLHAFPMSPSPQPRAPKARNKLLHAACLCPILAGLVALSLTTATAARRLDSEGLPLPTDAELTKVIVGTWKVDRKVDNSRAEIRRAVHEYETYRSDGTFNALSGEQEGTRSEQPLWTASGTWRFEDGVLIRRFTASNVSATIGHVARGKVESPSRDSFVLRELGNPGVRRRIAGPPVIAAEAREVPKIYSVEEAAKVLSHAVKPEYSREAQRQGASGVGMFDLRFDYETGRLKGINIVVSTGSPVLDHDAIAGLKEWKAKPRSVRVMRIQVGFRRYF